MCSKKIHPNSSTEVDSLAKERPQLNGEQHKCGVEIGHVDHQQRQGGLHLQQAENVHEQKARARKKAYVSLKARPIPWWGE